jgi:hypothetical protein
MNSKILLFIMIIFLSTLIVACGEIKQVENDTQAVVNIGPGDAQVVESGAPGESIEQIVNIPAACESLNGTWINEFEECEYISQEECTYLYGTFDECASACRHDLEAQACTLQCVPVCKFK